MTPGSATTKRSRKPASGSAASSASTSALCRTPQTLAFRRLGCSGWQHERMVISVVDVLGLRPDVKPGSVRPDGAHLSWELTVTPELLNSAGTLWGGVGLS